MKLVKRPLYEQLAVNHGCLHHRGLLAGCLVLIHIPDREVLLLFSRGLSLKERVLDNKCFLKKW
jgi:hypothetical protein